MDYWGRVLHRNTTDKRRLHTDSRGIRTVTWMGYFYPSLIVAYEVGLYLHPLASLARNYGDLTQNYAEQNKGAQRVVSTGIHTLC